MGSFSWPTTTAPAVSVISTLTNHLVTTINATGYSNSVGAEYSSTTRLVYVLENTAAVLLKVDPKNDSIIGTIPIAPNPGGGEGYAIDPATSTIYFPARGSDAIELIGLHNGTTYRVLSTPGSYGPTTTFLDPSNGRVYVMLGSLLASPGDQIAFLYVKNDTFVGHLTVGSWPDSYALESKGRVLYVPCGGSDSVSVVNLRSNRLSATVHLGSHQPGGLAFDPASGDLFVASSNGDQLLVIATPGHAGISTSPFVGATTFVPYGASRRTVP